MVGAEAELIALLEEEARDAARESLLAFTLFTFDGEYLSNWHHRLLCEKLEAFERGEIKRLIVCMPPRHGKSELASRRFPAWAMGRDPDKKIIACSYGLDLALDMSRDAKRIVTSDAFRAIFPDTEVAAGAQTSYKNTADQWQIVGHKGQYLARGVGGGITGKGGDFLIVDDPIKDDRQAQSATERENIWRWYTKVLKTRRSKGAGILVIMTRWHMDDLVGRLVERAERDADADQWEVLKLPGIAEEGDAAPGDPRGPGEALWPEFKDEAEWAKDKAEDEAGYASLGQQRPAPEGGAIIKTTWTESRFKSIPAGPGTWIWSCDPKAGSKDPKSSRVVIQLWFQPKLKPGQVFLVDQVKGLWDQPETIAEFRRLSRLPLWKRATAKLVENKADGKGIVATLKSEIPGLLLVEPQGDKVVRCKAVSPFWAAGNVWLPDDSISNWVGEFVQELVSFPAAAHDDQVDAMALALSHLFITDGHDPIQNLRRIVGARRK